MKLRDYAALAVRGLSAIFVGSRRPLVGTIILGDRCNLKCAHCGVGNIHARMTTYPQAQAELRRLWEEGVRILFFCGGETMLWEAAGRDVRDLIREARKTGYYSVNVVTNGTLGVDLPEADLVLLSLDGIGAAHDRIRGEGVFSQVLARLAMATRSNVCVYSAINAWNLDQIRALGEFAQNHPAIRCISFNFHTPYQGTEHLALSAAERFKAVEGVRSLIREGFPVFNLEAGLDRWLQNDWRRPCKQCVVIEEGTESVCGRCIRIPGLCEKCGYLFAVEFSLIFQGDPRTLLQMIRTYPRYA